MNILLDLPTERCIPPKSIGWKAYTLSQTWGYLKSYQNDGKVQVPLGTVLPSEIYNNYLRELTINLFRDALDYLIEKDPGVIEELGDRLGCRMLLEKGEERKAKMCLDELVKKRGLKKVFHAIVKDITKHEPRVSDPLGEWAGDNEKVIKNKISQNLSPVIGQLLMEINSKVENWSANVIYLRASTYSDDINDWLAYHTGLFGSIPVFVRELDNSKIVYIYSTIFSSSKAMEAVIKSGLDDFSMAILVQEVSKSIVISGNVLTKHKGSGVVSIPIECIGGLCIKNDAISELFNERKICGIVRGKGKYLFEADYATGAFFGGYARYYGKYWKPPRTNQFIDDKKSGRTSRHNTYARIEIREQKFTIDKQDPKEIKIPTDVQSRIYSLTTYLYHTIKSHIRIEFVITESNEIYVVQCHQM